MGLAQLVDNGNRVVVKCVEQGSQSLLWVAVDGADRDSVALIRNQILADMH